MRRGAEELHWLRCYEISNGLRGVNKASGDLLKLIGSLGYKHGDKRRGVAGYRTVSLETQAAFRSLVVASGSNT